MSRRALPLFALFAPLAAAAAAPPVVPVTGYLTDDANAPIDAQVVLDLTLYDPDGTALWTETQTVDVDNGQFTVYLGEVGPLGLDLFRDNGALSLGIAVDGAAEMAPRFAVATAPFAAYAEYCASAADAATVGGIDPADIRVGTEKIDWTDLENVPADLADGDLDTTYTAGVGLVLTATEFTADKALIEGWATGVAFDTLAELRTNLDPIYAAKQACTANQVLMADSSGVWACTNSTALPLSEAAIDAAVANNGFAAGTALTALTTRVTAAETAVTALQTGATALTARVTTAETSVTALQTTVTALAGGRSSLETTRVIKGNLGGTVAIGSIANNGTGETANIKIRAHCSNAIEVSDFDVNMVTYIGTTAQWLELPMNSGSASYQGRGNFVVDAYRANIGSVSDPLFLRVRNAGGNLPGEDCTVYVILDWDNSAIRPAAFTAATAQSTIATPFNATSAPAGGAVSGTLGSHEFNFPVTNGVGWGPSGGQGMIVKNNGNVGIGTSAPTTKLEVAGVIKAPTFNGDVVGTLNGVKMYAGRTTFTGGTCNLITSTCAINLAPGLFTAAPICTLTMNNPDNTGYTEKMVIKSTTTTALTVWKGQYLVDGGTTMIVNFICVGA